MATPVSTIQMNLTTQPGFLARVQYLMGLQAEVVLGETGVGATHDLRATYAKSVIANPAQAAANASVILVHGVNITSTTTYNESSGVATCTCADIDMQAQIATFWNTLAGINTGN